MLEYLRVLFLVLHLFLYTLMTFLMVLSVILLSMMMMLLSTLCVIRYLICGNNQNQFLNLNLIYETLWTWTGSGVLSSMLQKLNWFCLTDLITQVLLILKYMGLSIKKTIILMGLTSCSKLDWGSCIISIDKIANKEIAALTRRMKVLLKLLSISINLPENHAWNSLVFSRLVPLVVTWYFQISYKNGYAGLLVLYLLPLLNP